MIHRADRKIRRGGTAFSTSTKRGREGPKNAHTLWSKYWLANTLYKQGRYEEAEQVFRQVLHGEREGSGGRNMRIHCGANTIWQILFTSKEDTKRRNRSFDRSYMGERRLRAPNMRIHCATAERNFSMPSHSETSPTTLQFKYFTPCFVSFSSPKSYLRHLGLRLPRQIV